MIFCFHVKGIVIMKYIFPQLISRFFAGSQRSGRWIESIQMSYTKTCPTLEVSIVEGKSCTKLQRWPTHRFMEQDLHSKLSMVQKWSSFWLWQHRQIVFSTSRDPPVYLNKHLFCPRISVLVISLRHSYIANLVCLNSRFSLSRRFQISFLVTRHPTRLSLNRYHASSRICIWLANCFSMTARQLGGVSHIPHFNLSLKNSISGVQHCPKNLPDPVV